MRMFLLVALLVASVAIGAATTLLKIKAVQARLFLQNTGTLSPALTPEVDLWNTIIGEGEAGEPSTSTLIDVVVEGAPGSYPADSKVLLVVTNATTGKVKARLEQRLGVLSMVGISHVPFWLSDTGCEPLKVEATLGASKSRVDV